MGGETLDQFHARVVPLRRAAEGWYKARIAGIVPIIVGIFLLASETVPVPEGLALFWVTDLPLLTFVGILFVAGILCWYGCIWNAKAFDRKANDILYARYPEET